MYQALKEKIIAASQELGIDKIGFTDASPFDHLKASLEEQKKAGHTTGFEHQVIDERIYPDLIFDQPQSIISIAFPTLTVKTRYLALKTCYNLVCNKFFGIYIVVYDIISSCM